ncbi:MAG: hypothetical protein IT385_15650 [Deltaproteobacteria bacterium]|nr:hypothetical protein [Deltaproteobacteria bacterium]
MSKRPRCWQCRTILDLVPGRPIGRSETCPECDADLRSCRACAHWDQAQRACREPTAEVPPDAERRNFCGAFQLAGPTLEVDAPAPVDAAAEARKKLEALFKK